jgi:hypothetical protein
VIRVLGISGGVYAALCAVVPLAWGLAVAWVLHRLPQQRRENPTARSRDETGRRAGEYHI